MKTRLVFFWICIVISLSACSTNEEQIKGCIPPPKDFSEINLVGTWVASHLDLRRDTLIIRDDHKYKQIIHLETPRIDYESDWQNWRLEYTDKNLPYLHMEGMHLCAYAPDLIDCNQVGGGEEDQTSFNRGYWYDFCQDKMVLMPNEGLLIVSGVSDLYVQPQRGIVLRLLMYTDDSWVYMLKEP